jgi:hypothetical protein
MKANVDELQVAAWGEVEVVIDQARDGTPKQHHARLHLVRVNKILNVLHGRRHRRQCGVSGSATGARLFASGGDAAGCRHR